LHYIKTKEVPDRNRSYWTGFWIVGILGIICLLLGIADRYYEFGHWGLITLGLYGAVAVACLGGKLMSDYLRVPLWQICSVYIYAMIQLSYPFFDLLSDSAARLWWFGVIFLMALVAKWVLHWIGSDMFNNGRLVNYLGAR
jgi:hypothetical protein